ncbi:MAG TPA: pyridoxal 5'-phosphate synthase glutaminase subunit PdxT [Terriglobia bacterium]|jgi:5'-phosphate synthase pdxT subunit|nr:pyridoxal 5'-phosphate synthase glutaminase subunit PdxT [Terriglobia bacterium]
MSDKPQSVGILAIQGDFALHARMLDRIGAPWLLVKHAEELSGASGLIMPGGESTTMLKFFQEEGLGPAILDFAAAGKPIFGTCAGAILLAKEVLNPDQSHLGLIDVTVERNAYGRQIDSAVRRGVFLNGVAEGPGNGTGQSVEMVFIRAPIIRRVGDGVRVLGRAGGLPVLVEQGNVLAATFHPELTEDETIHRYFLGKAGLGLASSSAPADQ